jgi:uncharacterized membrane protein
MSVLAYLAAIRGEKPSFSQLAKSMKLMTYLKFIVNYILVALIIVGSVLALIIPVVFILPRVVFSLFLVADKNLGPIEALAQSWELSKGHNNKVWGIIGVYIAFVLLFITIIGIPFGIYFMFMYGAAFYLLYEFILRGSANTVNQAVSPVVPESPPATPIVASSPTSENTSTPNAS